MTKSIDAVLFDLDGTLIDSEFAAVLGIKKCLSSFGLELRHEDEHYMPGRTWSDIATYLKERYKVPVDVTGLRQAIVDQYHQILEENLPVVPGAVDAVKTLVDCYPLGLVSGSDRKQILWALRKLGIADFFSLVLGAEDYERSKPSPDGYSKGIALLSVDAARTCVFEDSQAGIQSAREAGSWVVAVTSTNHFEQDLSKAHLAIPDLSNVTPAWLEHQMETVATTGK